MVLVRNADYLVAYFHLLALFHIGTDDAVL